MIDINKLRAAATAEGLLLHKCHDSHWQVCDDTGPLVNVWPTTGKVLDFEAPPGKKAHIADINSIIVRARMLTMQRSPAAVEREFSPPAVPPDDDPFAEVRPGIVIDVNHDAALGTLPAVAKKSPLEKKLALCQHLLRLAHERLALQPGRLNDALCAEIREKAWS